MVAAREAISHLMESQIKQRMLADVSREYSFRTVDRAMPPDVDDVLSPKRTLMALEGLLLGIGIAVLGAFAWRGGSAGPRP